MIQPPRDLVQNTLALHHVRQHPFHSYFTHTLPAFCGLTVLPLLQDVHVTCCCSLWWPGLPAGPALRLPTHPLSARATAAAAQAKDTLLRMLLRHLAA